MHAVPDQWQDLTLWTLLLVPWFNTIWLMRISLWTWAILTMGMRSRRSATIVCWSPCQVWQGVTENLLIHILHGLPSVLLNSWPDLFGFHPYKTVLSRHLQDNFKNILLSNWMFFKLFNSKHNFTIGMFLKVFTSGLGINRKYWNFFCLQPADNCLSHPLSFHY